MWEYLLAPFDPDRAHEISSLRLWHSRLMFLAWGVLAPLAIIIARFYKVLPAQDWPKHLDNQLWWRCHWIGQSLVLVLTLFAGGLVYFTSEATLHWHSWLGYLIVLLVCVQACVGYYRGTKGGPSDRQSNNSLTGDHYSMTRRRRIFEMCHKSLGYILLIVAVVALFSGLWLVNSPRWMWILIALWWCLLFVVFGVLQRRGLAIDTYQAIWGPDRAHPGNSMPAAGWGTKRYNTSGCKHAPEQTE